MAVLARVRPEHTTTALARTQLGWVLVARGNLDEAKRMFDLALATQESRLGPEHAEVAGTLRGLADLHLARASPRDAVRLGERALAIYDKAADAEPQDVRRARITLGNAYLAARRTSDALRVLEQAHELLDDRTFPLDAARTEFALARALRVVRRDPDRASTLVKHARERFQAAGSHDEVAQVDRWLARLR